jgi:hypothetical protein
MIKTLKCSRIILLPFFEFLSRPPEGHHAPADFLPVPGKEFPVATWEEPVTPQIRGPARTAHPLKHRLPIFARIKNIADQPSSQSKPVKKCDVFRSHFRF